MVISTRGQARLSGRWVILPFSLLLWAGAAIAGPGGELDPSFGDDGRVLLTEEQSAHAVLQQPGDGKLVVAGYAVSTAGGADFLITRLNADGSIDTAFGQDGLVTVDFDGGWDAATALVLQEDGKIIAGGTSENGALDTGVALVRLNADGSLDTTYGVGGRVRQQVGGGWETLADMELDDTGGVVVALTAWDMVFARFDVTGMLDPTFGTAGKTTVNIGDDYVYGLLRQPDGKLVACGAVLHGEFTYDGFMSAVRLNPDGSLDPTFGTDGVWQGSDGFYFTGANDCGLMADGSIVLAGFGGYVGETWVLSALLDSNGVLASERWDRGTSVIEFAAIEYAKSLAVLEDGYLAITGVASTRDGLGTLSPGNMFVALVEPVTGLADPGFGKQGITDVDFEDIIWTYASWGEQIIQQADGNLVVAGFVHVDGGFGYRAVPTVVRIHRGDIDTGGFLGSYEREVFVEESDAEVVITVMRAGGSTGAVTLDYETINGTATAPGDFVYASGTLTWDDADLEPKTIRITIADDGVDEYAESFAVKFSNSSLELANAGVNVTIAEHGSPAPVSQPSAVRLPTPPPANGGGALDTGFLLFLLVGYVARRVGRRWSRPGGCSCATLVGAVARPRFGTIL